MMPPMAVSRVRLPRGVREPYTVYLNGVPQEPGRDFTVERGVLVFQTELRKEGRLGFWRWFWGAWGIGTYRKNDQVDVAWEVEVPPASRTRSTSSPIPARGIIECRVSALSGAVTRHSTSGRQSWRRSRAPPVSTGARACRGSAAGGTPARGRAARA